MFMLSEIEIVIVMVAEEIIGIEIESVMIIEKGHQTSIIGMFNVYPFGCSANEFLANQLPF